MSPPFTMALPLDSTCGGNGDGVLLHDDHMKRPKEKARERQRERDLFVFLFYELIT